MICVCDRVSVRIRYGMIAPGIVFVLYHDIPAAVKQGKNIPQHILAAEIGQPAVFDRYQSVRAVEELQPVALFEQITFTVVIKPDAVFAQSSAGRVIAERIAVIRSKRSAARPCRRLAAIGRGIADGIICTALPVIRGQLVTIICVGDRGVVHLLGHDIAVIVIREGVRVPELSVDFLFQPAERIIRIGSRAAVVCNGRDILTGIIGNGNVSGPRHAAAFREGIAVRLGKGGFVSTLLIIRHGLRQRQVERLDSEFISLPARAYNSYYFVLNFTIGSLKKYKLLDKLAIQQSLNFRTKYKSRRILRLLLVRKRLPYPIYQLYCCIKLKI